MWMEERNDQIHLKGEALGGFLKPDCWEGRKAAGEGDSPGRRRKRGAQALPKKRGDGTMEVAVLAGILQRRGGGGGGGTCCAVGDSALSEAG